MSDMLSSWQENSRTVVTSGLTNGLVSQYFIGVKTTQIYCYPWCSRKPKPENTIMFESREEAERAGYRACRFCFPGIPHGWWEDKKTHVRLKAPQEFSFNEVLVYLTRSPNECLYHVENGKVNKLISIQGQSLLIHIESNTPGTIDIHFLNDRKPPKKSLRIEAARYVWDWFDLGTDLMPFYQMAQGDPLLRGLVNQYYGLRIVGVRDLFEALCWAIIGQQINLRFAYTLKRRFIETFGTAVCQNDQTYWIFPTPARVACLSPGDITPLQFTQKKSEYLIHVAQRMSTGELTKQKLLALNDFHAIEKELTAIRGIGPWTANYVTMRCLRNLSAFPIEDVGLHNAIKQQLGLGRKPTLPELREMAARWNGWEAYVTFYLWRSLQGLSA